MKFQISITSVTKTISLTLPLQFLLLLIMINIVTLEKILKKQTSISEEGRERKKMIFFFGREIRSSEKERAYICKSIYIKLVDM